MPVEKIAHMLLQCGTSGSHFPAADLYNEGWMLCVVMGRLSQNPDVELDLSFTPNASISIVSLRTGMHSIPDYGGRS